jgi:gas vesicle protein
MRRDNSSLAIWFLSGAVLGAVVAALITPETGPHARRKLMREAERGRKSLLESGQELFARGRELCARGREIVDEAADVIERSRRIAEKKIEDRI